MTNKPILTEAGVAGWQDTVTQHVAENDTMLQMHVLEGQCFINTIEQQIELLRQAKDESEAAAPLPAYRVCISRELYDKIAAFLKLYTNAK